MICLSELEDLKNLCCTLFLKVSYYYQWSFSTQVYFYNIRWDIYPMYLFLSALEGCSINLFLRVINPLFFRPFVPSQLSLSCAFRSKTTELNLFFVFCWENSLFFCLRKWFENLKFSFSMFLECLWEVFHLLLWFLVTAILINHRQLSSRYFYCILCSSTCSTK